MNFLSVTGKDTVNECGVCVGFTRKSFFLAKKDREKIGKDVFAHQISSASVKNIERTRENECLNCVEKNRLLGLSPEQGEKSANLVLKNTNKGACGRIGDVTPVGTYNKKQKGVCFVNSRKDSVKTCVKSI